MYNTLTQYYANDIICAFASCMYMPMQNLVASNENQELK